jgi:hypothetical protein
MVYIYIYIYIYICTYIHTRIFTYTHTHTIPLYESNDQTRCRAGCQTCKIYTSAGHEQVRTWLPCDFIVYSSLMHACMTWIFFSLTKSTFCWTINTLIVALLFLYSHVCTHRNALRLCFVTDDVFRVHLRRFHVDYACACFCLNLFRHTHMDKVTVIVTFLLASFCDNLALFC